MSSIAERFCEMVANDPSMPHAAARLGAWLIGSAQQTGGFPLELTVHQITKGFERGGVTIPGMGGRYETIRDSVKALEERHCLETSEGKGVGFGYSAKVYNITI